MELSFCNFIVSFGAILFNKGLILLEEKNQTAPVVNAFFQYLNNSSNATETKIHLLDEIRKSDPNNGGDTLDMKNINETYKNIINMGFHPHGGIHGYLAKLSKETPITTLSVFKERVLKDLSENNIQNSCSSKNATSGLSALAIEKLSDFLWPDFVKQTTGRNSNYKQKREVEVLKRYKRQVDSDSDDGEMEFNNDLPKTLDIFNRQESLENRAHLLQDIHNSNSDIDNIPSTSKKSAYQTHPEISNKIRNIGSKRRYEGSHSIIRAKNSKNKANQQQQMNDEEQKQPINLSKTKRMWSIEKAASEISKRNCHNYNYNESLNLLKGYLLSPNKNTNSFPTYDQFVDDFCEDLNLTYKYNEWIIPKHPLIDEVLFQSYFHDLDEVEVLLGFHKIVQNTPSRNEAFELYKNSSVLQSYLSIQDYFLLRAYLKYEREINMEIQKRLTFALLRLSLKECETESLKNNIKLNRLRSFRKLNMGTINNAYPDNTYTFDNVTIFSSLKDLWKLRAATTLRIEIELENTAGIPNVDLIFKDQGVEGKYIIPSETTFEIIYKGIDHSSPSKYLIIMQDNHSKEKKMIRMIEKMYNLLIEDSYLFKYYKKLLI